MKAHILREIFGQRPYRPLEIVLESGERFVVPHPEAILIADALVAFVPPGYDFPRLVNPDGITEVRPARPAGRKR